MTKHKNDFDFYPGDKHEPEKKPPPPDEIHLPSKNFCGRCIYNIPSGTFILLFPGLGMLCTGIVILSWASVEDDAWHSGVQQAGLILCVLGGALTLGAALYWTYMWCRTKPKDPQKTSRSSVSPQKTGEPVSLVGVYKLRHDGSSIPAAENGTIATIS